MTNKKGVGNDILELGLLLFGLWASWRGYLAIAPLFHGPALSVIEFFGLWYILRSIIAWLMPRPAQK